MNTDEIRDELVQLGNGAHALAFQILGNADDAADAVQDALTKALSRPTSYDLRKGPLKPWFLRVVRNGCFDLLRRRRPTGTAVEKLVHIGPGPEQDLENSQLARTETGACVITAGPPADHCPEGLPGPAIRRNIRRAGHREGHGNVQASSGPARTRGGIERL